MWWLPKCTEYVTTFATSHVVGSWRFLYESQFRVMLGVVSKQGEHYI